MHAVSVGETRAAQPLIDALRAAWPDHGILLTCMTPTGRAAGREVYGESVIQAFLPYDMPLAVNRFFRHFSPKFGVLMETEIWPNLLAAAETARSAGCACQCPAVGPLGAWLWAQNALAGPAIATLSAVAAQTQAMHSG
ncbi:MAG: hypothetical protein IPJ38_13905 [Dechloromonas sp.]|uniref:3-deoxy-D-manno-octulosonic acid transferase n=1 Tax=Candidatus Dechloromonas phosphorivorans TaxID=2899244 RepID=A0A935MTV3_9RHOO|nr:hypothetical protein [Candidatus Dechloromonas phosphorivorans]